MKLQHMKRRVQRGFTLVELAIVLVIAGLILVAVLRGTDAIQKAQVERMVSDLRGLQGILLEFQKRNGRLPGDCDNNGMMLSNATMQTNLLLNTWTAADGTADILDFGQSRRQMPAVPEGGEAEPDVTCTDVTTTREANINLVWNELRRAGVVDSNRLPRELARHSMGDVFLVSTMREEGSQPAGVIVVYGIPVWMAEAVDASLDGAATLYGTAEGVAPAGGGANIGPANSGRVRLWDGGGGAAADTMTIEPVGVPPIDVFSFTAEDGTSSYDQGVADRDRLISISFQYTPNKLFR